MLANCSEHFKIVMYEVSSLKISSQNLRENSETPSDKGSQGKVAREGCRFQKLFRVVDTLFQGC
jgi:hypothetical protein